MPNNMTLERTAAAFFRFGGASPTRTSILSAGISPSGCRSVLLLGGFVRTTKYDKH